MNLKKEILNIVVALLPLAYLGYIWDSLPAEVPLHYNYKGEVDRVGSKASLIMIPFLMPILTYIMMTIVPHIDPKGKVNQMGEKYDKLTFLITLLMSLLAIFILYTSKDGGMNNPNLITIILGVLYTVLGNYFSTIKPNYFIGLKTPWTLNSEVNWKKTHSLASKIWVVGGLLIIMLGLLVDPNINMSIFLAISIFITIVPMVYSYLIFKKEKAESNFIQH